MFAKLKTVICAFAAVSVLLTAMHVSPQALSQESRAVTTGGLAAGWHRRSMMSGDLERWFRVFVPEPGMAGRPVVLLLHGGGQSMNKVVSEKSGSGRFWPELAKRERFLLLVPNGVSARDGNPKGERQHWNDLRRGTTPVETGADDVSFLLALMRWARGTFATDPGRVYVTGASNGGLMTYTLLIAHPETFAAGAAFIANLPQSAVHGPRPARPVPIMIVNGTDDRLMPHDGGTIGRNRGTVISAAETARWWVEANGAGPAPAEVRELPDRDPEDGCRIRLTRYATRGDGTAPVHFYEMIGGGHATPSVRYRPGYGPLVRWLLGQQCRDAEAAELAWAFFRQFGR